jgi:hypothetical protein
MIHYRKILELHDEGISLRGIAASTGNSRQKVTDIIGLAEKKGLVCPLEEEMTDKWIEEFLFPEKTLEASGRHPLNFDYIHEELAKPNVTLSLLHHEYEAECRANQKIPYSYRKVSDDLIEIFFNHMRVASHKRLYGKFGQSATIRDHMPDNHKLYVDQTPEAAIEWAENIGASTLSVIRYFLDTIQTEKLASQSIFSLKIF